MKIYFFCIIWLSLGLSALTQGVRFGIFGDPKLAWMAPASASIEQNGIRPGIHYGFFMDNFFAENYAFSTGLSFDNMGASVSFKDTFFIKLNNTKEKLVPGSSLDYHLQYLRIPFGLKFYTDEIGYAKFYADLGLTTGVLIKATADLDTISKANVYKEMSFMNLGYHIGLGMHYSLGGNTALLVGLIYTNGFWNVTRFDDKVTLNNVALRVGIVF